MTPIIDWNKKSGNYYKLVDMNAMTLQELIVLTFENCTKSYDSFNSLSINQIIKRPNHKLS